MIYKECNTTIRVVTLAIGHLLLILSLTCITIYKDHVNLNIGINKNDLYKIQ